LPSTASTLLANVACGRSHLAGLVAVVVDRLLAQQDQAGLLLVDQRLQQLGHRQRLQFFGGLHQDGAIGADRHCGAQGFLALRDAAGHRDDFGGDALFLQPHGLFDGDLVERVHAHLHIGDVHTRVVRFHPDFHVVIHHPLDRYQDLHARAPESCCRLRLDRIILCVAVAAPLSRSGQHSG
jgi:hypothetical protein